MPEFRVIIEFTAAVFLFSVTGSRRESGFSYTPKRVPAGGSPREAKKEGRSCVYCYRFRGRFDLPVYEEAGRERFRCAFFFFCN